MGCHQVPPASPRGSHGVDFPPRCHSPARMAAGGASFARRGGTGSSRRCTPRPRQAHGPAPCRGQPQRRGDWTDHRSPHTRQLISSREEPRSPPPTEEAIPKVECPRFLALRSSIPQPHVRWTTLTCSTPSVFSISHATSSGISTIFSSAQ